MEYVISESSKEDVKELCKKLLTLGWLMESSTQKEMNYLGSQLVEIADEITEEMNACIPEGVE